MTRYLVVVGEGVTDPPLVCDLADRLIQDRVDWLQDQDLSFHRTYGGLQNAETFVQWSQVKTRYKERFQRSGHRFLGQGPPDYRTARKLFQLIAAAVKASHEVHGVLVFRDTDDQSERRQGVLKARDEFAKDAPPDSWRAHIAVGIAEPKNEAWVLAGFAPQTQEEVDELAAVRRELGFAPSEKPERLTASDHDSQSKRSAKKVLDRLCGGDTGRKRICWRDTPLDTLEQRGKACGLSAFFAEIRARIVTLFR